MKTKNLITENREQVRKSKAQIRREKRAFLRSIGVTKTNRFFDEINKTFTVEKGKSKYFTFDPKNYKYHFDVDGNTKVSAATWSVAMGSYKYIGDLEPELYGMRGSCAGVCENVCEGSCYVKGGYRYASAVHSNLCNLWGLRNDLDKVYNDLRDQLQRNKRIRIIRINQSGEIENLEQLEMWFKLANEFKDRTFYFYTKRFNLILPVIDVMPENMHVNFSVWHDTGVKEYFKAKFYKKGRKTVKRPNVHAFIYDDGYINKRFKKHVPHCRAYNKAGKMDHRFKCGDGCNWCFLNNFDEIACNDH